MEKFNKTDKQEIILSAAEKLFALHGFDGTTTRMLASEANVNIAMLSYYYGSKEQLFKALLESRAANFYSKLQEAKGSSPILIDKVVALSGVGTLFGLIKVKELVDALAPLIKGRLVIFFPGSYEGNNYRLLDGYDGWNYLAVPITADKEF